jgi:hypothetical protein
MRTLRQLPVAQDGNDSKFPNGQIKNQDNVALGTPVVRELYGDIITNIYKIIESTGIEFTQDEDSEDTQYQLFDALKIFTNNLNDLEQVLTVNEQAISVGFNIDGLPNRYLFMGKLTEAISSEEVYSIQGTGEESYAINPTQNIAASSIVLVVLNSAGTTIMNLSSESSTMNESLNVSFGDPLSFNSSNTLLYFANGDILTDTPASFKIEESIQVAEATANVKVVQTIAFKNKLICLTLNTSSLKYKAFAFALSDLTTIEGEINIPDTEGVDNQPYMYCDGEFLYFTNSGITINSTTDNFRIGKFSFDEINLTINSVSFFEIDSTFEKTTNVFINKDNQLLYSFTNGSLISYSFDSAPKIEVGFFNTVNGLVFKFNNSTYYSNGENAKKWNY